MLSSTILILSDWVALATPTKVVLEQLKEKSASNSNMQCWPNSRLSRSFLLASLQVGLERAKKFDLPASTLFFWEPSSKESAHF